MIVRHQDVLHDKFVANSHPKICQKTKMVKFNAHENCFTFKLFFDDPVGFDHFPLAGWRVKN